ncbi:uncharacterized protein NFIA_011680 [Aspergillus fischeri NRRL 181]|uniref:Uncharacterized protein n=1 Tax=Neosartorya fischeri (strain ATCC 1020 / DSM 3700 / CBS 544.65 / FGSC A1164 / JCM 1740 / NRRL 181 / WB 181) TaxID=331117 RepID=A1D236_NEOFI|nr:uncharacterized protein NFIA_011680 [Aspergillus fischeri NRRL 181]EAW22479.1 hypothetical protein NFIA_011680 [Aspergillus fischeri NRRL 181]
MSGVLQAQGLQLRFSDFKAAVQTYGKTPHVACITEWGHIRFVGELKVPWVTEHSLTVALRDVAMYSGKSPNTCMRDLDLRYGFISTYNQTIFLRQHQDPMTGWEI